MNPLLRFVFPSPLPMTAVDGGKLQEVTQPIDVILQLWDGRRFRVATIEPGFRTDGVSRPGLAAWWIKRWGPGLPAAVLHDWLLELMRRGSFAKPKFLADLLLLMALVADDEVSFLRACLMFLAVRTKAKA